MPLQPESLVRIRPSWNDYWYEMAKLVSSRATCLRASCGCVIVSSDNRILTTGYNGSLPGEPHCLDVGCAQDDRGSCKRTVHAEMNAVLQGVKNSISLVGGRAYVYRHNTPGESQGTGCCADCQKLLNAAGVQLVGCWDDMDDAPKPSAISDQRMLNDVELSPPARAFEELRSARFFREHHLDEHPAPRNIMDEVRIHRGYPNEVE